MFIFSISKIAYAYENELLKISNESYEWNIRAYDPVGKTAIVKNDFNYGIWYIENNSVIELEGLEFDNEDVYYSPDGTKAILGNSYSAFFTGIYVIDIKSASYDLIDFSDLNDDYFDYISDNIRQYFINDNIITIFTSDQVYRYNIKNKELNVVSDLEIFGYLKLSPNGKHFVNFSEGILAIRNASNFKQIKSFDLSNIKGDNLNSYNREYICYSPNGKYLAVSFENGKTNIYDTDNYNLLYTLDTGGSVSFCNDDSMIVVGSSYAFENERFTKIYDFDTEKDSFNIVYEAFKGFITADGKYLIGNDISIYDALPITYRLEKIYIKPTLIKMDLSKLKNIDLKVVGVYNNGEEKIINNSNILYSFDIPAKGRVESGKLYINTMIKVSKAINKHEICTLKI